VTPDPARLRALPLFDELSEAEREQVAGWAEERQAQAGERLVTERAAGYEFFVIEEGTAEITHDGEPLRRLGPGDFFGEMALLGSSPRRAASVVATSPLRALVIHGLRFRELETQLPDVAERIKATMRTRLASE
jgi:CRP-like cAMP-binding protein